MLEGQGVEIEVFETKRFTKALDNLRLSDELQEIVDDEIDKVVDNPDLGTQKKGDLSYLWVHKFRLNGQEVLLGYSWLDDKIELYLLNLGSHENFYKEMKKRRKADLKIIGKK
ncbi:type II toxin-antitoxin system RelE/ParE family toxin [Photobacterium sanguinicancri]|uniref:Addiction module toxin RelE n=1 Tax=Photobacterium sanguinicancri TaxID=875932 RepID=A0ABX4FTK9_9GAMM|nr:type II toxin-antitoxin system RelE/ParE family toxin [Photobacterium sanguinicancri]OZS42177.1 addiction module toxin RelE [Photobacterium sanguinicancri]